MKKFLVLLLALVMVLSFAACGSEEEPAGNPPVEQSVSASDSDYDQLIGFAQSLIAVEDSLAGFASLGDALRAGTVPEEEALSAYSDVANQAVAISGQIDAAEWRSDAYDYEKGLLKQAADAMYEYTTSTADAMSAGWAEGLDNAIPFFEDYMNSMDALLDALGV